jgi:predicted dehydrogenase
MYNAMIIGVSGFGNVHYHDLKNAVENGEAKIIGATVINRNEEQEKCDWLVANGTPIYSDWQKMLEELRGQADICFIPTGIVLHAPMSIAAMQAGTNVFVEKPAAATIQEVNAMRKVSEYTGRFVAVGYQNIYQPDVQELKRLLLAGEIGKLRCLKAKACWPRNNVYYNRNNWAGKFRDGDSWILDSPFNNALAHFLNLLCFFAGQEFDLSAKLREITAELYRANAIESADTACLAVKTATDADIRFCVTHASTITMHPYIEIYGDDGSVVFDTGCKDIIIRRSDKADRKIPIVPSVAQRGNIMNALRTKLENPAQFICSLQIAGTHTLCVNGAHESSSIQTIGESFKKKIAEDNTVRMAVDNIENIIDSAFAAEKNFSELGVEWARPGNRFSLEAYSEFTGGRTA